MGVSIDSLSQLLPVIAPGYFPINTRLVDSYNPGLSALTVNLGW